MGADWEKRQEARIKPLLDKKAQDEAASKKRAEESENGFKKVNVVMTQIKNILDHYTKTFNKISKEFYKMDLRTQTTTYKLDTTAITGLNLVTQKATGGDSIARIEVKATASNTHIDVLAFINAKNTGHIAYPDLDAQIDQVQLNTFIEGWIDSIPG
jgi:hypothetical protein